MGFRAGNDPGYVSDIVEAHNLPHNISGEGEAHEMPGGEKPKKAGKREKLHPESGGRAVGGGRYERPIT